MTDSEATDVPLTDRQAADAENADADAVCVQTANDTAVNAHATNAELAASEFTAYEHTTCGAQSGMSSEYAEWEATLAAIVPLQAAQVVAGAEQAGGLPRLPAVPSTVFVLGGMDVGKTTFTRLLVNRWTQTGQRVAVLDGDIGQSEIGPPTCVGLAFARAPVPGLSSLPVHALAFVGSASPVGHLLDHMAGVRRLADLRDGCPLVVDTSGYLHGSGARRLNQATFDLLAPTHVVALQRRGELEDILAPMRRRDNVQIYTPPIPAVIGKKPAAFRSQRRVMRFASYFQNARLHTYALDDIALVGAWLGSGVPLAPHLLKYLGDALASQTRVFYAEMADRQLNIMVSQPMSPDAPALGLAQQTLKAQGLTLTVAPRLKHLLLGLEGGNGKLLGLGLLEAIDFRRRTLGVLTPCRAPAAARVVRTGSLRVQPNGTEAGSLRPGEI